MRLLEDRVIHLGEREMAQVNGGNEETSGQSAKDNRKRHGGTGERENASEGICLNLESDHWASVGQLQSSRRLIHQSVSEYRRPVLRDGQGRDSRSSYSVTYTPHFVPLIGSLSRPSIEFHFSEVSFFFIFGTIHSISCSVSNFEGPLVRNLAA